MFLAFDHVGTKGQLPLQTSSTELLNKKKLSDKWISLISKPKSPPLKAVLWIGRTIGCPTNGYAGLFHHSDQIKAWRRVEITQKYDTKITLID
jgi:hypothetical protein